jgi:transposase-like protein
MKFTDAERRLIAVGFRNATSDQRTYAAKHGISTRTLRGWVRRYAVGDRPEVRVRAIVEGAIQQLQDLLAGLDAEAERRNASGEMRVPVWEPDRRAGPEAAPRRPAAPVPMPNAGFFRTF